MDDIDGVTCHSCHFNRAMFTDRKVLVTLCFHKICNVCLIRILRAGKGVCPACGKEIKQSDVQTQKFEDLFVDREIRVRKRMLRIFNKLAMDFPTTKEYDDYLEMVEDIIYNLANDTQVEETNARIDQYRRENQDVIDKNRTRINPESHLLETLIESETEIKRIRNTQFTESRLAELESDQIRQAAILNELASSNLNAVDIVNHHSQLAYRQDIDQTPQLKLNNHTFDGAFLATAGSSTMQSTTASIDPWMTLRTDESHALICPSFANHPSQYHDTYSPAELRSDPDSSVSAGGYSIKVAYIRSLQAAYLGLFVDPI